MLISKEKYRLELNLLPSSTDCKPEEWGLLKFCKLADPLSQLTYDYPLQKNMYPKERLYRFYRTRFWCHLAD